MDDQSTCPFCGLDRKRSKEHVIPRWLLTKLGINKYPITTTHYAAFGGAISRRGPMSLSALVNGRICEACNNGWMSSLERSVQPIVERMLDWEKGALRDIDFHHGILARWSAKTALVLNHHSNYRRLAPLWQYQAIRGGSIPEGTTVSLGFTVAETEFKFLQSPGMFAQVRPEDDVNLISESYKISFQFRHLLLRVAYAPHEEYVYDDESIYLWPIVGITSDSSLVYSDLSAFHHSGVLRPGTWPSQDVKPDTGPV